MATPYVLVCVTAPAGRPARRLAAAVVQARLAACVNVAPPVTSVYRWKGKVETAREALLLMKTRRALFRRLASFVAKNHPYDVPEVIAVPIVAGHAPYLTWIAKETA